MEILEFLIQEAGFKKIFKPSITNRENIDYDSFDAALRIHEIHYLYYSELHKYFSLVIIHDNPKGKAGGGIEYMTSIMIPRVINTIDDAVELLNGMIGTRNLKMY